jgi:hypothetical protein
VSMPSKKRKDGTFKDIAHPLNNQMRQYLEEKVLSVYRQQVAAQPSSQGAPSGGGPSGGAAPGGSPQGSGGGAGSSSGPEQAPTS